MYCTFRPFSLWLQKPNQTEAKAKALMYKAKSKAKDQHHWSRRVLDPIELAYNPCRLQLRQAPLPDFSQLGWRSNYYAGLTVSSQRWPEPIASTQYTYPKSDGQLNGLNKYRDGISAKDSNHGLWPTIIVIIIVIINAVTGSTSS